LWKASLVATVATGIDNTDLMELMSPIDPDAAFRNGGTHETLHENKERRAVFWPRRDIASPLYWCSSAREVRDGTTSHRT
jgi:hypothetical protein